MQILGVPAKPVEKKLIRLISGWVTNAKGMRYFPPWDCRDFDIAFKGNVAGHFVQLGMLSGAETLALDLRIA